MVVTSVPSLIDDSGTWQERVGWPSISTVQAPQSALPQPYLVPVRFSESRRIHSRGVSPGTLAAMSTRTLLTKKIGMGCSEGALDDAEPSILGDFAGCLQDRPARTARSALGRPSAGSIGRGFASARRYNVRLSRMRLESTMEAEQLNAMGNAIAGLKDRAAQLRRYL